MEINGYIKGEGGNGNPFFNGDRMNKLQKFKLTEGIKDRYTTMFIDDPEYACSMEGIDSSAGLVVETIERFEDIREQDGLQSAIHYLVDILGYYTILCSDILAHNKKLIELLKQKGE